MMSEVQLIRVEKAGEALLIHPTCLKAHQALGWRVSEDQAPAAEPPKRGRKPGATHVDAQP